jgi:hypothetical protein
MQTPKTIERRLFLASTAATVVANVTGCTEDGNSGTGPSSTNSTATGTHSSTGGQSTATSGGPTSSNAPNSSGQTSMTGGTGGVGSSGVTNSGGSTSGVNTSQMNSSDANASDVSGSGGDSSDAQGSGVDTASSGETSTSSGPTSSEPQRPSEDACFESGGTDGGMAQDAGGGVLCSTNTDNGNHCHPLAVPQSEIEQGFAEATYNLEDGGTGHTHTVTLTAYDVAYLQAGFAHEVESTTEDGHSHMCLLTCSL